MVNTTNSMLALLFQSTMFICSVIGIHWDHSVHLNDDYRLLWTISKPQKQLQQQQLLAPLHPSNYEVTFEVQVRTLGYIGFGFSPDGDRAGADVVIGWVDQGQTYFQVSATPTHSPLNSICTVRCSIEPLCVFVCVYNVSVDVCCLWVSACVLIDRL